MSKMKGAMTIRPEEFSSTMIALLKKYGDEANDITERATKNAARRSVKQLKGSAPAGGSYARGWSHKKTTNGVTQYSETVYNRTDYQLIHLMEKPHKTGGGKAPAGHYPAHVDYTGTVAKVEDLQTELFIQEVISKL